MVGKYFIRVVKILDKNKEVPYYLDSKIKDLVYLLSLKEKAQILNMIMEAENPSHILRYFSKIKILHHFCFYLDILKKVPQSKGKTKNAFEHTLNVLDQIPSNQVLFRWVGLLHDLGKYESYIRDRNFNHHSKYSASYADFFCDIYQVRERQKIVNIVKNHMTPLDYQKRPDWSNSAIKRFIDRVGEEDILDVVDFAYYDKQSENNVKEYLDIITELRGKIIKILES